MIAFLGIEYNEDGILYFVNVGMRSVWSKRMSWLKSPAAHNKVERIQKRIAAEYLAQSIKRDIDALKRPKVKNIRPLRRAI